MTDKERIERALHQPCPFFGGLCDNWTEEWIGCCNEKSYEQSSDACSYNGSEFFFMKKLWKQLDFAISIPEISFDIQYGIVNGFIIEGFEGFVLNIQAFRRLVEMLDLNTLEGISIDNSHIARAIRALS